MVGYWYGKTMSEEHRKKLSESHKGLTAWNKGKTGICSEETRKKMSDARRGRPGSPHTEESKRKLSVAKKGKPTWIKGKHQSEEHRRNISLGNIGKIISQEAREKIRKKLLGGHHTEETKLNMSESRGGRRLSAEWCENISVANKGNQNRLGHTSSEAHRTKIVEANLKGFWYGNIRYCEKPQYCKEKWTPEFRNRIRAFFGYQCLECGTPQKGDLLHCHHVYYDKKACCSVNENGEYFSNLGIKDALHDYKIVGDPNKFVALCDSCHGKSSIKNNRRTWARHFEEMINDYYERKSYFTKDEYDQLVAL